MKQMGLYEHSMRKRNYYCFLILIITVSGLTGCSTKVQTDENQKPNFLFILVDDLGKEWISAYGADSVVTPAIDALAASGMTFHNAYSMPQCTPSRVTLLTGEYPFNHGWINHYDVPRWGHGAKFDPERNASFAAILREGGYKTCAAGKWQINDFRLEPDIMVKAGFDEYCMWTGGEGGNERVSSKRYWDPYIHAKDGSRVYEGKFGPDIFSDFIIGFMRENREHPMCIYYPMVLTHGPLVHTPLEPVASTKMEKHKAMVRYTDYIVEKLVKELGQLGIRDHTYLIFTTDNGTAGNIIGSRDSYLIRGGKTFLTENGVNAPFIVSNPGTVEAGTETKAVIDFTDILPTFLDLAGLEVPENLKVDGKSFSGVIHSKENFSQKGWILAMGSQGGKVGDDGMIRNWYEFRDRTLRDERYKIYVDTLKNINRIFDLESDPHELNNLITCEDGDITEILEKYKKIVGQLPDRDQHPDYTPLDTSIYNIPPEDLVRRHHKGRRDNMSPVVEQLRESRPNIILCMADDLGWGDVGYNGNTIIQTPNLDEMAAAGIQFNRFYSGSSVCSPTRGSCLSGRNPYRYGIYTANRGHLKEEEVALPEIFKELGYATGHFGKWHLGTLSPDYSGKGKNRNPERNYMTPGMTGFEEWFSTEYAVATYDPYDPNNKHNNVSDPRALYWHNGVNITGGLKGCDSKIIMDKAIPFIRRSVKKKQPFFAVIWFHAPHAPVVGHPEYMGKFYSDYSDEEQHYYSVVTALDAQVGRLRSELKELRVADNTILCFTSDNGPEGNPGKNARFQGSAKPFRGRKRSLYEGGVRVPGVIEYPARFGEHRKIDVPCVTSDYFPTFCEMMGLDIQEYERPYDGISLWDIMTGKQTERKRPIGFQFGMQKSMVDDQYKLVNNLGDERHRSDNGTVPMADYELYDLVNDPYETKNIIDQHPDVAGQMIRQLDRWVAACQQSDEGADYQQESKIQDNPQVLPGGID